MPFIDISRVCKTYPNGTTALHDIDLAIEEGEFCVLVGPSGCGKSTLLRMIAGLESITSGTVSIAGRVVNQVEPGARDIAMVFQNYALYPHMTVRANMEYVLKNKKLPRPEIALRVNEAARILELTPYLDRRPAQLSGGQRQRVAMGRAIVRQPRAFLFDEPLSNLDAKLRTHMRVELRSLQQRLGTTAIHVTHDQLEAMTMADRLVVMNAGRIEQVGRPDEIYARPQSLFVAAFMGAPAMNLVPVDALPDGVAAGLHLPGGAGVLGFRPEAMRPGKGVGVVLELRVEASELTGADRLVHLTLPGHSTTLTLRGDSSLAARPGAIMPVTVPLAALHVFDAANGRRMETGPAIGVGTRMATA